MLPGLKLAVGRTGRRAPPVLSLDQEHTVPHPWHSAAARHPLSWPWRLQLRPHGPSSVPSTGTRQGQGYPSSQSTRSKYPCSPTGPLGSGEEGAWEGGSSGRRAPPCLEKAISARPPLQLGCLVGCCTTYHPGPKDWAGGLGNLKGPNRGLSWVGQGQRGVWELAAGSGTGVARLRPGRHSPPLMDEPGPMVLRFPGTRGTRGGGGQRAWQSPRAWAPGATILGSGGANGPNTQELFLGCLAGALWEGTGAAPPGGRMPPERMRSVTANWEPPPHPSLHQIHPRDPVLTRFCP